MPISASYIILTSLAPSPTASVIYFKFFLKSLTMRAFCLGVSLQHTTASQSADKCINSFYSLLSAKRNPNNYLLNIDLKKYIIFFFFIITQGFAI